MNLEEQIKKLENKYIILEQKVKIIEDRYKRNKIIKIITLSITFILVIITSIMYYLYFKNYISIFDTLL